MTSDTLKAPSLTFTQISLHQMRQVEAIRSASGNTLYAHTFTTLFSWKAVERYEICLLDDAFLVKNGSRGENAYLFPCGTDEGKRRLIDSLLLDCDPVFYFIGEDDKRFLEKTYPRRFIFSACRDDYPYLYDKNAQISLTGKAYKKLRHQVNLGSAAAQDWTTEPLTDANVARALDINRRWARLRAAGDPTDTAAVETALRHFSQLDMWGLLFQADGEDVAYVAGSFVTPEIFDISFCKVLNDKCDCFIKWALYRALPDEVKTVDSEEDMGLAGLRTHKLLRIPKELTRVWKGSLII